MEDHFELVKSHVLLGNRDCPYKLSDGDRWPPAKPDARLLMLSVKTTCKDRWRQVVTGADRIAVKHGV
jgi:hypothetical protein